VIGATPAPATVDPDCAVRTYTTPGSVSYCTLPAARDELVLHLSDNGIGVQGESVQPGMGMTVMSAWVETLGGQWSLGPSDSGTTLTATIPAHL
jgi:glucose-6-phosphate-specific signal transduction histidine kinase